MIGHVTIARPEGTAKATLWADGSWSYEGDPFVIEGNLRFAVECMDIEYRGPSQGAFGPALLRALASRLTGAVLHIEPTLPSPAGVAH